METKEKTDAFIQNIKGIPVIPEVAAKVLRYARELDEVSFKDLERTIKVDPGIMMKILKVANSALYARQREVKDLSQAINLLGFTTVKSLVLLVAASGMFRGGKKSPFYSKFWHHSVLTAFLAKEIAIRSGFANLGEELFIGGLLHDIGQPVLFLANPTGYDVLVRKSVSSVASIEVLETEAYGVTHRDVGGALLRNWNFPPEYADFVMEHNSLNITSAYKRAILMLSLADLVAEKIGYGTGKTPDLEGGIRKYLQYVDFSGQGTEEFEKYYYAGLETDPYFIECRTLFGF